jgi:hypothetical protein
MTSSKAGGRWDLSAVAAAMSAAAIDPQKWVQAMDVISTETGSVGAVLMPIKGVIPHKILSDSIADLSEAYLSEEWFKTDIHTNQIAGLTTQTTANTAAIADHEQRIGNLEAEVGQGFGALKSQISQLGKRDSQLADGIAISLALAQPVFQAGQTFAVRAGWGNFDGSNAFGVTAAGLVTRNGLGIGTSVVIDDGLGTSTAENMIAGRAGMTLGW